jgi:hypothetical protein
MITTLRNTINNENGFVLVVAVLMLVVVTVIGLAATRTSETEVQIAGNERQIVDDLYNAESTLINLLENPSTWLPTVLTNSSSPYTGTTGDYTTEIRWIDDTGDDGDIVTLSDSANDLPSRRHIGPPPPNSGYSLKFFEVRWYGVTTSSANGSTRIQTGVYKVFNK